MTEDKVKNENDLYKMKNLAVANKMLLKREESLCRKMNDQSYSMVLERFTSWEAINSYVDEEKANISSGLYGELHAVCSAPVGPWSAGRFQVDIRKTTFAM